MKHQLLSRLSYDKSRRVKAANLKIYYDVVLLEAGDYADSISKRYIRYSSEIINKYAKNWSVDFLCLDHKKDVLSRVGKVKNPHIKNGKLVADLYIYTTTRNGHDIVENIENGLVNWVSVEAYSEDEYNHKDGIMCVKYIEFIGTAIVTLPAYKGSQIKEDGPSPGDIYYE